MEGRVAKTFKTMALLEQPFIKDDNKTVATVVKEAISTLGENIQVRRFERCALHQRLCSASAQHWGVCADKANCRGKQHAHGPQAQVHASSCRSESSACVLRRFVLGEGMESRSADLAAEVEAQTKAFEEAAAKKAAAEAEAASAAPAQAEAASPAAAQVGDRSAHDGGDAHPAVIVIALPISLLRVPPNAWLLRQLCARLCQPLEGVHMIS